MMTLELAGSQRAEEFDFYLTSQPEAWGTQIAFLGNGHCIPVVQAATGVPVFIRVCGGADTTSDVGDQFSVIVIPKRVSSEDIRATRLSLISSLRPLAERRGLG